MLRSVKALHGYTVLATDGDMGKVHDFYLHDDSWTIRYLVVDTGHWLTERKVLVATGALGRPNWAGRTFPVALTRSQVAKSPEIDTDKPVCRQHEMALYSHYGWPFYWSEAGPAAWPEFAPAAPPTPEFAPSSMSEQTDPHLRSTREVAGYHIRATDGPLGHVEDFITEDAKWVIRYLVIHTGKFLPAKKVLISPQWLGGISYTERLVEVTMRREEILNCPEFHPGAGVNRQYEERIYDYYGRPTYWEDASPAPKANR